MMKKSIGTILPLMNKKGEVRELTRTDLMLFKPAKEVLPASLLLKLGIPMPKIDKLER